MKKVMKKVMCLMMAAVLLTGCGSTGSGAQKGKTASLKGNSGEKRGS